MSTKKQHYVPRVYLKAWKCQVERQKEPKKKFQGVYYFRDITDLGEGANIESIMWSPHLYTIQFDDMYISKACPKVHGYFANKIYEKMRNGGDKPIYAKFGHSVIRTRESVRKHLFDVQDWEFYYDNDEVASKSKILRRFDEVKCYLLEEEFDKRFENKWERLLQRFLDEVKHGKPIAYGSSERVISKETAQDMLSFFLTMLCRNPEFSAMDIYRKLKDSMFYPIFEKIAEDSVRQENKDSTEQEIKAEQEIARQYVDEIFKGVWFSELYRLMFKNTGGFYHEVSKKTLQGCQMILFETTEEAPHFITSDNPAFEHISRIQSENQNGFIFPLTPRFLLMFAKGENDISIVDFRSASTEDVKCFNSLIATHRNERIVADTKHVII